MRMAVQNESCGICLVLAPPACYPEIASPAGLVSEFRSTRLSMKIGPSVIRLYAAMIVALVGAPRAGRRARAVSAAARERPRHGRAVTTSKAPSGSGFRRHGDADLEHGARRSPARTIDFKNDLGLEDQTFPSSISSRRPAAAQVPLQFIPLELRAERDAAARRSSSTARRTTSACRSTRRSTGRRGASATSTTSSSGIAGSAGSSST